MLLLLCVCVCGISSSWCLSTCCSALFGDAFFYYNLLSQDFALWSTSAASSTVSNAIFLPYILLTPTLLKINLARYANKCKFTPTILSRLQCHGKNYAPSNLGRMSFCLQNLSSHLIRNIRQSVDRKLFCMLPCLSVACLQLSSSFHLSSKPY
jgi:hypothetical protein